MFLIAALNDLDIKMCDMQKPVREYTSLQDLSGAAEKGCL